MYQLHGCKCKFCVKVPVTLCTWEMFLLRVELNREYSERGGRGFGLGEGAFPLFEIYQPSLHSRRLGKKLIASLRTSNGTTVQCIRM